MRNKLYIAGLTLTGAITFSLPWVTKGAGTDPLNLAVASGTTEWITGFKSMITDNFVAIMTVFGLLVGAGFVIHLVRKYIARRKV